MDVVLLVDVVVLVNVVLMDDAAEMKHFKHFNYRILKSKLTFIKRKFIKTNKTLLVKILFSTEKYFNLLTKNLKKKQFYTKKSKI